MAPYFFPNAYCFYYAIVFIYEMSQERNYRVVAEMTNCNWPEDWNVKNQQFELCD